MKEIRKAMLAAMKDQKMMRRAVKDAAESHVRGMAYREADKMRAAAEAEEEAKEGKVADNEKADVLHAAEPGPRAVHASPAAMAAAVTGKRR